MAKDKSHKLRQADSEFVSKYSFWSFNSWELLSIPLYSQGGENRSEQLHLQAGGRRR